MKTGVVLALILALALLAGCGEATPGPSPTPTPSAVAYTDPTALYDAIQKAGAPKVEEFGVGDFSLGDGMPDEAQAKAGHFLVALAQDSYSLALSDGTPAVTIVAAVFPDASHRAMGTPYGRHMAEALGWPWVWRLEGPNWLIWSVEEQALQSIRQAIGGTLARTPAVTASPTTAGT